jgi:hypothetical protein
MGHGRLPYPHTNKKSKQETLSKTIIKLKLLTFGNLKCVEHLCVELLQSLVIGRLTGPHQGEETTRDVATTAALVRYSGFRTRVQELNRKRNEHKRFPKTKNIKLCFMTLVPNFAAQGRFARKNEFRQNAKTVN